MTSTSTRRSPKTGNEAHTVAPWSVVLWNSLHPMSYVVWVLKKTVPSTTWKRAAKLMLEAHRNGRAVVKSCHQELAEHYAERIGAKGLNATAEPGE
jgi:ATP-dependent Clp protease adaptor protein ClpS